MKVSIVWMWLPLFCALTSTQPLAAATSQCSQALVDISKSAPSFLNAVKTEEFGRLLSSNVSGDLIEFWIPGSASYQGRVLSIEVDSVTETVRFNLQGQFGSPRLYHLSKLNDVKFVRGADGAPVQTYPNLSGSEIDAALKMVHPPTPGSYEDAVLLARDAHGPQLYNDHHYLWHINSVVEVLTRFGITDPAVKIAGILHDAIEDTDLTYDSIRARYGKKTADIVKAVTLPSGVPRAEAFELAYPVIRGTPGALLVKLADRIANFEDAIHLYESGVTDRYVKKYSREWPHFRDSLKPNADSKTLELMNYLETLSAKYAEQVPVVEK